MRVSCRETARVPFMIFRSIKSYMMYKKVYEVFDEEVYSTSVMEIRKHSIEWYLSSNHSSSCFSAAHEYLKRILSSFNSFRVWKPAFSNIIYIKERYNARNSDGNTQPLRAWNWWEILSDFSLNKFFDLSIEIPVNKILYAHTSRGVLKVGTERKFAHSGVRKKREDVIG